jgi:hypothetical protein
MMECSHDRAHWTRLLEREGSVSRCRFRWLHLGGRDDVWIEGEDTRGPKRCLDRFRRKSTLECCSPHKCEVSLSHLPPSASLKGLYLLLPDLLHPSEAHDIKALKGVSTVGWITENDDVVLGCVAEELWVVVGAVAVED